MMQIKKLTLTHKKDLRVILEDFQLVLNDGDKAVIIGEEGNGKIDAAEVDVRSRTDGRLHRIHRRAHHRKGAAWISAAGTSGGGENEDGV